MNEKNKKFETKKNPPIFKTFQIVNVNSKIKRYTLKKIKTPEKISNIENKKSVKFLTKKTQYFKTENFSYKKNNSQNPDFNYGRWTKEERFTFLQGISLYGANWKKIKGLIPSRTAIQVRSHAQKFRIKMKSCKDEQLGIDFTLPTIHSIKDMINKIRSVNSKYNIVYIFKHLSDQHDRKRKLKKQNKNVIIHNESTINENKYNNLEENKNNYINNNIINNININDINKNGKINTSEKTKEKNESNERINKNLSINFIPPNNDIKLNSSNYINNYSNHFLLNKKNTFLNINNNILNTLNNIKLIDNIYNDFILNNYNNYYNNLNDNFLINFLLANNPNAPFRNVLSMINLFNSLINHNSNMRTMEANSNNNIALKEQSNNTSLNKNNKLTNDNTNMTSLMNKV